MKPCKCERSEIPHHGTSTLTTGFLLYPLSKVAAQGGARLG
jgi:hypothetical protein